MPAAFRPPPIFLEDVPPRSRKGRILIVDDYPAILVMLRAAVTCMGYEVVTATDGVAAVQVLEQTAVDLILLDLHMPRLDGLGFLKHLRGKPRLRKIPVIVTSGRPRDDIQEQVLAAGAVEIMAQPFALLHLHEAIERHLPRSKASRTPRRPSPGPRPKNSR